MEILQEIKGIDIYLLDQLMKGTFTKNQRILDAGCGTRRNLSLFLNNNFNVVGIDTNKTLISELKSTFSVNKDQFISSNIEKFEDAIGYDSIICNAILHFAKDHAHFNLMFDKLIDSGVYQLPDLSTRYLITEEKIVELLNEYALEMKEPIKTVNVNNLRCMTTLVFTTQ